ncbi:MULTISPECIES: hypothetical protein [unclassified Pseudofrankia]|uniref:hypothetical protein n=1 Tax=unclassified Pseudofrankia TaxID=2994372 RepID=UPI0010423608|nr:MULTISPECIES: hypothetical protein [unclassified Pseudofrankia]MDT3446574.1 hypothetical protein [Pseudofrankia sp. BMG5.37]
MDDKYGSSFDIRAVESRRQALENINPVIVTSSDSHIGLPGREYLEYLDPKYRQYDEIYLSYLTRFHEMMGLVGYPFPDSDLDVVDTRGAIRGGGEMAGWTLPAVCARRRRTGESPRSCTTTAPSRSRPSSGLATTWCRPSFARQALARTTGSRLSTASTLPPDFSVSIWCTRGRISTLLSRQGAGKVAC